MITDRDNKYFEFWLKMNTFLKRQNILTEKMYKQEGQIAVNLIAMKAMIPPDVFKHIIDPLIHLLEERKDLLLEMSESSNEFMEQMYSFIKEEKSNLHDD